MLRTGSISPCVEPSGLAMDAKDGVLFSVCDNKMMVVADMKTLKVLATPAIAQVLTPRNMTRARVLRSVQMAKER